MYWPFTLAICHMWSLHFNKINGYIANSFTQQHVVYMCFNETICTAPSHDLESLGQ